MLSWQVGLLLHWPVLGFRPLTLGLIRVNLVVDLANWQPAKPS